MWQRHFINEKKLGRVSFCKRLLESLPGARYSAIGQFLISVLSNSPRRLCESQLSAVSFWFLKWWLGGYLQSSKAKITHFYFSFPLSDDLVILSFSLFSILFSMLISWLLFHFNIVSAVCPLRTPCYTAFKPCKDSGDCGTGGVCYLDMAGRHYCHQLSSVE